MSDNLNMQDVSTVVPNAIPFKAYFGVIDILDIAPELLDRLNDVEKEELELFSNLKRQREYLSSRVALKELASGYEIDISRFTIEKDELGQPYGLIGGQQYYVSIAHTDRQAFCGISHERAIGVDLEPLEREVPDKLMKRIKHPDEDNLVRGIEAIRLWTIKEAYIKLRGQGLRLNMNEVPVRRDDTDFLVELNNDKSAKICSFQMGTNWLAIAYYR